MLLPLGWILLAVGTIAECRMLVVGQFDKDLLRLDSVLPQEVWICEDYGVGPDL